MSSNVSTPYLEPTTGHFLGPPSPSPFATHVQIQAPSIPSSRASTVGADHDLDSDIPPLSLDILTTRCDKAAALKLVADSIAQQRHQASLSLATHPLSLAVLTCLLAAACRVTWARRGADAGTLLTLASGAAMAYLVLARYLAGPYARLANAVGWDFLLRPSSSSDDAGEEEDLVLGSRYGGGEIVGALVLRLEPGPAAAHMSGGRKRSRGAALKGGKGVVRAWTTKSRVRGRGLGGELLREAVRITKERCGRDAEVGFAREHANSAMVLPEMFNGSFRRNEVRAARALEAVLADWEAGRRKR